MVRKTFIDVSNVQNITTIIGHLQTENEKQSEYATTRWTFLLLMYDLHLPDYQTSIRFFYLQCIKQFWHQAAFVSYNLVFTRQYIFVPLWLSLGSCVIAATWVTPQCIYSTQKEAFKMVHHVGTQNHFDLMA